MKMKGLDDVKQKTKSEHWGSQEDIVQKSNQKNIYGGGKNKSEQPFLLFSFL